MVNAITLLSSIFHLGCFEFSLRASTRVLERSMLMRLLRAGFIQRSGIKRLADFAGGELVGFDLLPAGRAAMRRWHLGGGVLPGQSTGGGAFA